MNKVICINDTGWMGKTRLWGLIPAYFVADGPKMLDTCSVTAEVESGRIRFYELAEWPGRQYQADCFVPISEIDETEFEREPVKIKQL